MIVRPAVLLWLIVGSCLAGELVVRHAPTGDPPGRNEYQVAILRAVLDSTLESHGSYRLEAGPDMPQEREIRSLVNGQFHDVLWTVTSASRENLMRPIRFPLLRGLLGHRICLARHGAAPFEGAAPPQADGLVIGQAVTWPDTRIFIANGFAVEAGSDYQSTLRMLMAGRTNCFPRGLSEIDIELAAYGSDQVEVESRASFLYFAPMYFFVAPDRGELADRLRTGLDRIVSSGQFQAIYATYFDAAELLDRYRMADRTSFCLENPEVAEAEIVAMQAVMIQGPGTFVDRCLKGGAAREP